MTRAALYCRISVDRTGSALGVQRQESDCRNLAQAKGWEVADVYVDNDISASTGRRRPAYERLLEALQAGTADAVVAWHPDRLHRSTVELERFINIVEGSKAKVATVQAGELDLGTAAGRMTARVVGAVARHEVEQKSERQRAKAEQLARAGKQGGGGARPYGFAPNRLTHIASEAKVVRHAAKQILAGESLRGVAADLNRRGVQTVTGTPWSMPVLRRILMAPRTAGLREYRGEVVADAEWEPILDRADHERIVRLLNDPARRKNQSGRAYLLSGFGYCALCSTRLVARPRADKTRCYVCASGPGFHGCGKIRVIADPLEALVVESVISVIDTPDLAAKIAKSSPQSVTMELGEVVALEQRLDDLAEDWADGNLDRRSWLTARKRIEERLEAANRTIAAQTQTSALEGFVGQGGALRDRWIDLGFDRQRAVLRAVLDRVVVGSAVRGRNTFDPTRITIEWRV